MLAAVYGRSVRAQATQQSWMELSSCIPQRLRVNLSNQLSATEPPGAEGSADSTSLILGWESLKYPWLPADPAVHGRPVLDLSGNCTVCFEGNWQLSLQILSLRGSCDLNMKFSLTMPNCFNCEQGLGLALGLHFGRQTLFWYRNVSFVTHLSIPFHFKWNYT